jgi:hypothetical protein
MNTINASTGFSGFQLHLGHSPHVIPPLVPTEIPAELTDAATTASGTINRLLDDVADAQNNLLLAKISQAHYSSTARSPGPQFVVGDLVMLSTTNRRHKYIKKGEKRTAKFFP